MILTCPSCSTRYFADGASLGPKGRAVRCAACGHTWHAREGDEEPPLEDNVEADGDSASLDLSEEQFEPPPPPPASPRAGNRPLAPGAPNVRRHMFLWSAAGAAVLALMALAVVFRVEVVRAWPRTASAYAAAGFTVTAEGLVFENIAAEPGYADGEPLLTITADVRNTSGRARDVPPVRIGLYDDNGEELFSWSVALDVAALEPRQAARFTAKLAQPPADAQDLELRFDARGRGGAVPAATELVN
jgi:predicted Zn finger-like uncharacterized protein